VNPIDACIGHRASRIQRIAAALGDEPIDVLAWSPYPDLMIRHALAPSRVVSVTLDERLRRAVVMVRRDQFPLALGRAGENRELASRLSGWGIDIAVDPASA
jgi:N utilization substance protein A